MQEIRDKAIHIRISEKMLSKLNILSTKNRRTISDMVRECILYCTENEIDFYNMNRDDETLDKPYKQH